jgi:3-hydroxybutyryl-CoA dehydrogenase
MATSEKQINNVIRIVGIIGEGKMGTNLFYYLLEFGFSLVWVCSKDGDSDKIIKTFNKKIKRSLDAGIIDETSFSNLNRNTKITNDLQHLKYCDLIIEAIPEDMGMKQQLFLELERVTAGDCILASNSSSIKPSELSIFLSEKNRLIGLHFFYPVALKNIVEFIITDNISNEVIDKVIHFLSMINRDSLCLKEESGFILNKIYLDFQNEAFLIVSGEEITYRQMDLLIKKYCFPTGVFDFCDGVGNDIMLASVRNYTRDYPGKANYMKFILELERLVKGNRTGVKSGAGFYSYPVETNNDDLLLNNMKQDLIERVFERLQFTMNSSINRFSSQSGISIPALNNAMKEYLGSEKDLYHP